MDPRHPSEAAVYPSPAQPAESDVCLLRLSALGDVTHVVALLRALQRQRPEARISWVIGSLEARLLEGLDGVQLIPFDKRAGLAGWRRLRRNLRARSFDALLTLGVSMRHNLVSAAIPARRRIGYDRARAKDLHGLFINERIAPASGQHVIEAMMSFLQPLGLQPEPPQWRLPVPEAAYAFADQVLPRDQPVLILSACSSHAQRNWHAEGYATVARHASQRHGFAVALCGGRSAAERAMADAILAQAQVPLIDLVGKDTLKQLLALLARATLVVSPDSGPAHMANAVGTPVLGLYAATNPRRSGPYNSLEWCIDRYDAAAQRFRGRPADALPWGTRIQHEGVMDLIETEAVIAQLDRFVAAGCPRPGQGD